MKTKMEFELALLKSKRRTLITVAILVVIVLLIFTAVFYKGYSSATEKYEETIKELESENERLSDPVVIYEEASKEVSIGVINDEIQEIGELATMEYIYTDAAKFEDPAKIFGKDIPLSFTTKSFILKWDGCIKAGVKIDKIYAEESKSTKEIIVHIPNAEILSHEVYNDTFETLDEKNGLFNSIKVEDVNTFNATNKAFMEERAINNGLLDKAFTNAKTIISKLIYNDVLEEQGYTIRFEIIEE